MSESEPRSSAAEEPAESEDEINFVERPEPVRPVVTDESSVVVVGRNEDIAAICGRVDTAPTYSVVIHAPGGNRALSREIGIRRLKKHAQDSGRTVAIATPSLSLAARARQVQIPVARKPEHVRWDSGGRVVVRLGKFSLLVPPLGRYIQVLAIVGAAFGVAWLLFAMGPSATVVAYPPTETVEQRVSIVASTEFAEVDLDSMQLPATTVSSSRVVTLAVPTTGSALVGDETSVVTITVTNQSDEAVTLPEGTRFDGGTAPDFELREAATIPAGGQDYLPAYALEPGTKGNIEPNTIRGLVDPIPGVLVANLGNGGGGTDVSVRAVGANDVITIRTLARDLAVVDSIKQTIVDDRPHDAIFLDTADVQVTPGETSDAPGTVADVLVMDVRISVTAVAVVSSVLDQVARAVLSDGRPGEFIPGSVTALETGGSQFDADARTIEADLLLRGEFARGFSSGDIESAVKGKSTDGAIATLGERYGIQDAEVDLNPGWAPRLPRFGFRIDVQLRSRDTDDTADAAPTATATPDGTPAAGD